MHGCIAGWLRLSHREFSIGESQRWAVVGRRIAAWTLLGLSTAWSFAGLGCSREYYRRDADAEAARLIDEKRTDGRWCIPDQSVYGDSRSRYYDPNDPDCPPLPPDDPTSHELMHCVYGMRGSRRWHKNGELTDLENPNWQGYLAELMERTDDGRYVMDLHDAVQLSLLNSPRYQSNVETVYLSALDVAFERFRFDAQFFAGSQTTWRHRGSEPSGDSSTTLQQDTFIARNPSQGGRATGGASKLLPAGGTFLVDFANTFVWQFAGSDTNTRADSLLSFTFLQPLLRQGGREVALEQLTLAERGLLTNVRQMERYRQGFLIDVAMGMSNVQGPGRQGGFQGGAGLSGFTGTGTGGFGGVGEASNFGRVGGGAGGGGAVGGAAGGGFAAGVAGNVSGFIGLAQLSQQIRNREANLSLQLENLARMQELFAAGRIGSVQVDQFRQNVTTTRSQYLAAVESYQRTLENFLISTLGLPPDLPVSIDQSIIEPFQFTEPKLTEIRAKVNAMTERIRTAEDPSLETIRRALDELQSLHVPIDERFEAVRQDFKQLAAMEGQRLAVLTDEKQRVEFLEQLNRLKEQFRSLQRQIEAIHAGTKQVPSVLKTDQRKQAHQELVRQHEDLSDLLLELGFVQAGVRLESVMLPSVKLDNEQAFQIARANRLDMMNQRAEVVDQWRLIEFNADRLEADLNIELNGSIGTLDRNIVKFRNQTGSFSAGVRFDTPITRLAERNLYRQSLIDYQRVRRNYIQFEDTVKQSMRSTLRSVNLLDEEIELRRTAMRIAIRQMDLNQARLKEPPRVGAAAGQQGDPVRDLLQSFADFLQTQNDVMNTYLSFQAARMVLYRDLGIVRFDERGMWVDEPLDAALRRLEAEGEPFVPPPYPTISPAMLETGGEPVTEEVKRPAPAVILSPAISTNLEEEPVRQTAARLAPDRLPPSDNKSRGRGQKHDVATSVSLERAVYGRDEKHCF